MQQPNDRAAGLMRLAPDDGGRSNTGTSAKVLSGSSETASCASTCA